MSRRPSPGCAVGLSHRLGSLAGRLALLLLGTLVAVLLAELVVRLAFPWSRDHALPRDLIAVDPLLGWHLNPDRHLRHRSTYFDVDYETNALGYRDAPRTAESGRPRLLLYGDSQVFGWGVPAEERFSNLLEDRLGVEVLNLGVPGYGLDQEVLSYERDAERLAADAAVLFASESTLYRLQRDYLFGLYKPIFTLEGAGLHLDPPRQTASRQLLFRLPRWMYLPYFLDRTVGTLDERWRGQARPVAGAGPAELQRRLLIRAADLARTRDERLLVLSNLTGEPDRRFAELCRETTIPYLRIELPADSAELIFGPHDPHWNPRAHRLIADQLAPLLTKVKDLTHD